MTYLKAIRQKGMRGGARIKEQIERLPYLIGWTITPRILLGVLTWPIWRREVKWNEMLDRAVWISFMSVLMEQSRRRLQLPLVKTWGKVG
jgi:hypothetical protein